MEKTRTYKTAIYLRLSKEDGENKESQSISNQRKSIYEFIRKSNEDKFVVIDEYVDDGYSGTNFDRPDFQRLLEDIETKGISAIITKDLSRLGRDHILTGYYIENYFKDKGIRYIAINDNIDSKEDDSFDMLTFRLAFNDFYPKDTSKKILKIKKLKQEKGEYQGSWAPFGYRKSKTEKNKLEIEPEQAKAVKMIFDLYTSGKTTIDIVRILNENGIKSPGLYANQPKYMQRL
jgi:site-specific DNA recombinase